MKYGKETELHILETAKTLFGECGKDGVSTSEIAQKAEINKALIFYYFGSKDNLYKTAFKKLVEDYIEAIKQKLSLTEPGLPKIETFVREHIALLREKPFIVKFIAREFIKFENEPSEILLDCTEALGTLLNEFLKSLECARKKGEIRDVDPFQTIVNIMSLNIFYFLISDFFRLFHSSSSSFSLNATSNSTVSVCNISTTSACAF